MVTGRDVAARAGVSTATVSRVLCDAPGVSADVRERVTRATAELGYRPNVRARSLRVRSTQTVSLVVSNVLNPFFTELARAVEDAARSHGYGVVLGNADEDADRQDGYLEGLLDGRVDGLLLSPASGTSSVVPELVRQGLPVVLVDRPLEGAGLPVVRTDGLAASRQAAAHLMSVGHTRLAVLAGPQDLANGRERLEGFRAAAAEHGRPLHDAHVVVGGFDETTGAEGVRAVMATEPSPTAVFCTNNLITLGALQALRHDGVRVPDDVALVSFDDLPWFELLDPPVTAVRQPTRALGEAAVAALLARVGGDQSPSAELTRTLPGELVVRASCGATPATGEGDEA